MIKLFSKAILISLLSFTLISCETPNTTDTGDKTDNEQSTDKNQGTDDKQTDDKSSDTQTSSDKVMTISVDGKEVHKGSNPWLILGVMYSDSYLPAAYITKSGAEITFPKSIDIFKEGNDVTKNESVSKVTFGVSVKVDPADVGVTDAKANTKIGFANKATKPLTIGENLTLTSTKGKFEGSVSFSASGIYSKSDGTVGNVDSHDFKVGFSFPYADGTVPNSNGLDFTFDSDGKTIKK